MLAALLLLLASGAGLTLLVQLLLTAFRSGSLDWGWLVVAAVCGLTSFSLRRSSWVLQLLAIAGPSAHRARFVWGLLLFGVVLVAGLKLGNVFRTLTKSWFLAKAGFWRRRVGGVGSGGAARLSRASDSR